jgi:hypothetical protein
MTSYYTLSSIPLPVLRCFLSSLSRFAFLLIRSEHGIGISRLICGGATARSLGRIIGIFFFFSVDRYTKAVVRYYGTDCVS